MIVIGLDPGLNATGWGVIAADGNRLTHIANGTLRTTVDMPMARRLSSLHDAIADVLRLHQPDTAGIEEVFVNVNPQSTLKLGQARGAALVALSGFGLDVGEYATRLVKKAIVGTGTADKAQVRAMVERLLPGVRIASSDSADALAVAITHAHHQASARAHVRGVS